MLDGCSFLRTRRGNELLLGSSRRSAIDSGKDAASGTARFVVGALDGGVALEKVQYGARSILHERGILQCGQNSVLNEG
jgi:hypothetical protein